MESEVSSTTAEDFTYDPKANYDEQTLEQQREIEREVAQECPLIGPLESLNNLKPEYIKDPVFLQKIERLVEKYPKFRRMRGDGNCFFRSMAFALLEQLSSPECKEKWDKLYKTMRESRDELVKLGFPVFTLDDFHQSALSTMDAVKKNPEKVAEKFNEPGVADYFVVYLRLLTSAEIQKQEDFYGNFIEGQGSVREFCQHEVEPMYKESDNVHIIALTSALSASVRVEYLDRAEGSSTSSYDFPEGSEPTVFLLYRPGHYDVLYRTNADEK
ncbi:unnamed protein product [Cyprideis torosa]|uniref:Ubiquitin thioesterase n=1 Tax=Cyprideis torosa TaxID=163714 RepID=A0A7R8W0A2_9CRUS|nr:unnamed protein product [Cyprideis torosa]CAG0879538.1 unnamed protein product [Cyprideis torosa]